MKNMIYKTDTKEIDLSKVVRLYPAAVVDLDGERAEMSLEWVDMYGEKVKIVSFVLIFDFPSLEESKKNREVLEFETKEKLIITMQEVSIFFQD